MEKRGFVKCAVGCLVTGREIIHFILLVKQPHQATAPTKVTIFSPIASMLRVLLPTLVGLWLSRCSDAGYADRSMLDSTIAHGMVRMLSLKSQEKLMWMMYRTRTAVDLCRIYIGHLLPMILGSYSSISSADARGPARLIRPRLTEEIMLGFRSVSLLAVLSVLYCQSLGPHQHLRPSPLWILTDNIPRDIPASIHPSGT